MKVSMSLTIAITTFLLFFVTILASLNFDFSWVFYLTVLGQGFLIYMVYKVLTDNYKTEKTFDDFYEDKPIQKVDDQLNYRK